MPRVIPSEDLEPGQVILGVEGGEQHLKRPLRVVKVMTSEVGGPHFKVLCVPAVEGGESDHLVGKTFWAQERIIIQD